MQEYLTSLFLSFKVPHTLAWWCTLASLLMIIAIVCWVVNFAVKKYIVTVSIKILRKVSPKLITSISKYNVIQKLSHLAPALIIYKTIPVISNEQHSWTLVAVNFIKSLSLIYMLLAAMMALMAFLSAFTDHYQSHGFSRKHPIRGYLQVVKILLWGITLIIGISILLNKSPWGFLTGLGAMSAVIMLVFKDTIMGFVSSIQISAYDMVRVGDWITMKQYGLDGDVMDISINTVKVRNFDKTIVTVPTQSLMTNGVQNWRGMSESGGRRIKRSILINIDTIKFCDQDFLDKFSKIDFLKEYIASFKKEHQQDAINQLSDKNNTPVTNLGLFRAYLNGYLKQHDKIHKEMTFLIRQLEPSATGLPLQLYIFTNDVRWTYYEGIQSDIFDHILASLPLFNLQAFQKQSTREAVNLS